MQIGHLSIKTPIFLAPMAGVTDFPFRVLCKEFGASVVYSEFVSAHGIIRENTKKENCCSNGSFCWYLFCCCTVNYKNSICVIYGN